MRQPLFEAYAWRIWPVAKLEILNETAQQLIGSHDFGAFGTPPQAGGNTIRHVLESSWTQEDPYLVYEIKAHAFLYHMVRRIVFMQVSIAQSKLEITDMQQALDGYSGYQKEERNPSKRLVHGLAPAQGLILAEVYYPQEALRQGEDKK